MHSDYGIELFADGADLDSMLELSKNPLIRGFTTNPTLMRKAGVRNYLSFAQDAVASIPDRPISFEVFADHFAEMRRQAHMLSELGQSVYVKIPVTNTRGRFTGSLVQRLVTDGVKVNVTAILTLEQVAAVAECLGDAPSFVSVFAGRIADTGRDPVPLMTSARKILSACPCAKLIWASPREVLNVVQAVAAGCHVITATGDILAKLPLFGTDLAELSLRTVRMFHEDACAAGYSLPLPLAAIGQGREAA